MTEIIDFHAHAFPDSIAERAVDSLEKGCDHKFTAHTDGTVAGLLKSMDAAGVSRAVLCPIATKPDQFDGILQWVLSAPRNRFIALASVHPQADDIAGQLKRVADNGLAGIKIHPMYQKFNLDDAGLEEIFRCASDMNLLVTSHCGKDVAFGEDANADVERIARMLDRHPNLTFVATHLGGWRMWAESARLLGGRENVWFETSASLEILGPEKGREVVSALGLDRVLFGTDSPWFDHASEIENIRQLGLSDEETEAILSTNAQQLLTRFGK